MLVPGPYLRAIVLLLGGVLMFWLGNRHAENDTALYAVGTVFLVLGILRFIRTLRRA